VVVEPWLRSVIENARPQPENRSSTSSQVQRQAGPRSEVIPVRLPERVAKLGTRPVRVPCRKSERTAEDCVILVANPQIELQAAADSPVILHIPGIVLIVKSAPGIAERKLQCINVIARQIINAVIEVPCSLAELNALTIQISYFEPGFDCVSAVNPVEVIYKHLRGCVSQKRIRGKQGGKAGHRHHTSLLRHGSDSW